MKLNEIRVDASRIEEGAWVDNIPEMGDLRLKVKGINNASYRRLQSKLFDAVPRSKRMGNRLDPDEVDRITSQCLLRTVLMDWEGLSGEDGQPIPYSEDLAKKLLFEPDYRKFKEGVNWAATAVAEMDTANKDVDEKN